MDIVSYLLGKQSSGGETPTKGYTIDSWDENGYPIKITTYGYTSIQNYLFSNPSSINGAFKNVTNISLNEGITSIGDYGFNNNVNLTTINIPADVTSLGQNCFSGCSNLILTDLKNVATIANLAFNSCTSIKKLCMEKIKTISGSTTTNNSFRSCTSLKKVWIGSTITNAGLPKNSFAYCSNLEKIYIDKKRTTVETFAGYQYAFMNDNTKTGIIVCNDDEDFITKEQFDALVVN